VWYQKNCYTGSNYSQLGCLVVSIGPVYGCVYMWNNSINTNIRHCLNDLHQSVTYHRRQPSLQRYRSLRHSMQDSLDVQTDRHTHTDTYRQTDRQAQSYRHSHAMCKVNRHNKPLETKHCRAAKTISSMCKQTRYRGLIWHVTGGYAVLYAYTFNLIWISVLGHPCRQKKHQNITISTKFSDFAEAKLVKEQ